MNSLGIYFGPDAIVMVETKGREILNNVRIPVASFSSSELENKVPNDIKMVAVFKDELRRNKINVKEAYVALAGKDLIVRTFEMPVMPREELASAIQFEASRHIPFKIEESILDYQVSFDKAANKNLVLLIGIKKETLDKYKSIFQQLNLKISSVEYAAFSVLRLLPLAGVKNKNIISVLSADITEADEVSFTVMQDGFPLFSRDMVLKSELGESAAPEQQNPDMVLEKLKTEIRISLDYYHRNLPAKPITQNLFILNKDYYPDIESLAKDLGVDAAFVETEKCFSRSVPFSLSLIKAYAISLAGLIKSPLKVDLLAAGEKAERDRAMKVASVVSRKLFFLSKDLRIGRPTIIAALLICLSGLGLGFYQKLPIQKQVNNIISMRPAVKGASSDSTFEELNTLNSEYKAKIDKLNELIKKQLYLTEPLNIIPSLLPEGMWLGEFSFSKTADNTELNLEGMVYLNDSNKEFELVNSFLQSLKNDPFFSKHFKEMSVVSLNRSVTRDSVTVTNFKITCRNYKNKE